MNKDDLEEEKIRQLLLIQKMAKKLPWLLVGLSLLGFIFIFLEILYTRS